MVYTRRMEKKINAAKEKKKKKKPKLKRKSVTGKIEKQKAIRKRRPSIKILSRPTDSDLVDSDADMSEAESEDGMEIETKEMYDDEHEFMYYLAPEQKKGDIDGWLLKNRTEDDDVEEKNIEQMNEAYEQVSTVVQNKVKNLIYREHEGVYKQIANFCENMWDSDGKAKKLSQSTFPVHKIPTACFLVGGTSADEDLLLGQLVVNHLKKITPLVAQIRTQYFTKTISFNEIIKQIVKKIFDCAVEHYLPKKSSSRTSSGRRSKKIIRDPNEYKKARAKAKIPTKRDKNVLTCLEAWFRNDWSIKERPIILVFESIHLWPSSIVQSVFLHLHTLVTHGLPIVVIMGLTSIENVMDKLDFRTKRTIYAQEFRLAPANEVLDGIIAEVIRAPWWPFVISADISKKILHNFSTNFFSTSKFIESLNTLLGSHFSKNRLSKLCLLILPGEEQQFLAKNMVSELDNRDFEEISNLESMVRINLGRNKKQKQAKIKELAEEWKQKRQEYQPAFSVLNAFFQRREIMKINRRIQEMSIYFDLSENTAENSKILTEFFNKIKSKKNNLRDLENILKIWLEVTPLQYRSSRLEAENLIKKARALTTQRRKQLGQLHSQTTPLKKKPQSIFERLSISKTKHNSIHKRQKVTPLSRTSHRKNLKKMCGHKTQQESEYVMEVMNLFKTFVQRYLQPLRCLPLGEVFSLTDKQSLEKAFEVQPHAEIFNDLTSGENDFNIAFNHWDAADRYMNLAEWFRGFVDDAEKNFFDHEPSQKEKQAMVVRFRRCLDGLKMMGLIDDKCNRSDHVKHCGRQIHTLEALFKEDYESKLDKKLAVKLEATRRQTMQTSVRSRA